MSIEAQKWAMDEAESRELDTPLRYLLLMLGNQADHRGGNLFPSHGYLSRRTGMGKSTIRRHIASLEALGVIKKQPRTRDHDGSQTSNLYQLAMMQPGLDLEDPPLPNLSTPPASRRAPPLPTAASTREVGEVNGRMKKSGAHSARGTRLEKDWTLPQPWQVWAITEQPSWDVAHCSKIAAIFKDHWAAAAGQRGVKLDWEATWRNWVRKEGAKRGLNGSTGTGPAWWTTEAGIMARGKELDRPPQRGESMADYKNRLFEAGRARA